MKFWITAPRKDSKSGKYGYRTVFDSPAEEKRALFELYPKWKLCGTGKTSSAVTQKWLASVTAEVEQRAHDYRQGQTVSDIRPWAVHVQEYIAHGKACGGLDDTPWTPGTAKHRIHSLKLWTKELNPSFLTDVRRDLVSKSIDDWKTSGIASSTINNRLDALTGLFWRAKDLRFIDRNPLEGFGRLKKRVKNPRGHFTPDELRLLFNETPFEDSLVYQLAYFCRYRENELMNLKVGSIKWAEGVIVLGQDEGTKNKKRAVQPIPDHLVPKLWDWCQNCEPGEKLLLLSRNHPERRLYGHMERLGIPRALDGLNRCFHSLGHATATNMSRAGVGLDVIRHHMRHASVQDTLGYITPEAEGARNAVNLLAKQIFPQDYAKSRTE